MIPPNITYRNRKKNEDEKEYRADEIKVAFEEYLQNKQIDGWQVIVDREGKYKAVNVSQEKKAVNIPESRKLKYSDLLARMEHELGTHVLRRGKGEISKLKTLGLGLDRYLKGEEGIATYAQQKIKRERKTSRDWIIILPSLAPSKPKFMLK